MRVARLRTTLVMDVLHRLRHGKTVNFRFMLKHLKVDPTFPLTFLPIVLKILLIKMRPPQT